MFVNPGRDPGAPSGAEVRMRIEVGPAYPIPTIPDKPGEHQHRAKLVAGEVDPRCVRCGNTLADTELFKIWAKLCGMQTGPGGDTGLIPQALGCALKSEHDW
jgi:hypothetical protein